MNDMICAAFPQKNQANKRAVLIFGLFLFFANLIGFTAFRCAMSGDLFGGDLYNFTRNTSSYFLTSNDILKPADFVSGILAGKNESSDSNPGAFVWRALSEKGREAAEKISSGIASEWDKELFIVELNKSLVDARIDWPQNFLKNAKDGGGRKTGLSDREYNVRILASLFPEISAPSYLDKVSVLSLVSSMWKYAPTLFTLKQATRYAPLSGIYSTTLHNYLRNSPERLLSAIIFQAFFYAVLMTLVFFLALEVLTSIPWAFFSMLLFQTAVSTLLSTYTIFSLPYFFVPLVMVAALLSYLRYKHSGHKGYLITFILLAVVGPWFREFAGLIPYIVFTNEVLNFKKKRSVFIMALCVLLCVHSIYPSFLTWLVGLNKGEFFSVYAQNNRQQLITTVMNWMSPGILFVEVPPILWIIAWLSMSFWVCRSKISDLVGQPTVFGIQFDSAFLTSPKIQKLFKGAVILFLIVVPFLVGVYFFGNFEDPEWQHPGMGAAQGASILAVILTLIIFSLRLNTLIPIYFAMVFLPFLRIGGNTEVHMSFALAPLSILIVAWVRQLYFMLSSYTRGALKNIGLGALFFCFALGIADQAANVWACMSSQRAVVRANKEMADWIKTNLERHSVVICNFFNFYDVFYYSNFHFDPYETVENCPMGPANVVHADQDFLRLANKYFGLSPFYLLSNRIKYYEYQKNYHSHKYVNNPPGELEELKRFQVKNVYYYFDPFKFFIMRRFQTIPLYMDWSIDFYYNNTKTLFQRIVSADYTLYRLKNISKGYPGPGLIPATPSEAPAEQASVAPTASPTLVSSHKNYNVVRYDGVFFAVPQSLGPLDLAKGADRALPGILSASSQEEAQRLIDEAIMGEAEKIADRIGLEETQAPEPPKLVASYKNYNIVFYGNAFYAVPQTLGSLDLAKKADRSLLEILTGESREDAQKLVDDAANEKTRKIDERANVQETESINSPMLVGAYKNHNIVHYGNVFYVVPQSLGPLDLMKEKNRGRSGIFVKYTREEAEKLIDEIDASRPRSINPPQLVTRHKKYNVVSYDNFFYALPQSLGPLDLANETDRSRSGILIGNTQLEALELIDKTVAGKSQKKMELFDETAPLPMGIPILITDYKKHNIVHYNEVYYAVPQSMGPMDLAIEANRTRTGIVTGSSIKKAKRNIDKAQRVEFLSCWRQFFLKIVDFILQQLKKIFHFQK